MISFKPLFRTAHTETVQVNIRITRKPEIICVRQEGLDRARLRELANQCEDLCNIRGGFPRNTPRDDPLLDASIAALDKWLIDNGEELSMLLKTVKVKK